ncbi:hypothetical protein DFH06DRAFT_1325045 [Mycena polygramma]|nr:hypothetical protein DFH06DRAFT_1325045 [Mycena polygramma]
MFPSPGTYSPRLKPAVQHPMLGLENLVKLPAELRRTGNLLLISNSDEMRGQILSFNSTPERVRSLLPVWFANFDTAGIPSPDAVDAAEAVSETIAAVVGVSFALRMVPSLRDLPEEVQISLWARAWPWIEFLHMYREHLHGLPDRTALYTSLLKAILHFQIYKCRDLVGSTPVRPIVGVAWDALIDTSGDPISLVSVFMKYDIAHGEDSPGRIAEYLEGLSGGIDHMASLLLQLLALAFVDDRTPMSRMGTQHLRAVLGFFCESTVREDIATHLLPLYDDDQEAAGIVLGVVARIIEYATAAPGRLRICEALQAGLLRAVVLAATHISGEKLDEQINFLLAKLPAYMVYRSILAYLPSLLADVEDLVKAKAFVASPVYASWENFHALAEERLDFLMIFDSTPIVRYKGCDSTKCNQICLKSDLRRCSTCLDLYYCSKSCQTADWRAGHRDVCQTFSRLRQLPEEEQCSTKDVAFMRALLHRDYLAHRRTIYTQQISQWSQDPMALWYLLFGYMHGPVRVALRPWPQDSAADSVNELSPDWVTRHHNHGVRAGQAHGLLEVHVLAIPNGLATHWKIIPMRHRSPEIRDGLRAIARKVAEIPRTDPAFDEGVAVELELEPLLAMELNVIHE